MSQISKAVILIPALNEEATVGDVIREARSHHPEIDIVVIDDGSTDQTAQVARAAGASTVRLPFNLGVGGAMRTGFMYALRNGYDAAIQVDADGQHNPKEVGELIAALEHYDIAIGARFAGKGDYTTGAARRLAMKILASTLSRVAGNELTDTTSGFRASGPRALRLFAASYPSEYLGDTVESLVIASRSGLSITQIPVQMRPRAGGTPSHNPIKAAIFLARVVVALVFALMKPKEGAQK